jgi:Asp-tRNA(Asn)/Glu-tRNA(Gln) amidotransferase C subunit
MLLSTGKSWISNSQLKKEEIEDKAQLLESELTKKEYKEVLNHLKSVYSFVYIPVEIDVEDFTKIETENMQKIFDKCIKDEIRESLKGAKLANISHKLNSFMNEIATTLKGEYYYDTESSAKKNLTENDFLGKVLEVYFQSRILKKSTFTNKKYDKKVKELSAGEKRQALISLIYAFLKEKKERETILILGIDEPENSLHTSLCYEQFEKLKEMSKNNQILITTHWYGFLPIISEGVGHFLHKDELKDESTDGISFETYDLYDYRAKIRKDIQENQNKIPKDYSLKSTNDLVQSIFYSLKGDKGYNWLICEGISEKIYFEYFFKKEIENNNLKILPMGGQSKVSQIYEYLELPIKDEKDHLNGKVFCLIDTDMERHKDNIGDPHKNLKIKRLFNETENETSLITLKNNKTGETWIENALHPIIFEATMKELDLHEEYSIQIKNKSGNTDFVRNLKNYELRTFFEENEGENKISFAKEYVAIMSHINNPELFIPSWINEIKDFFKDNFVANNNSNKADKELITTGI